MAPRAIDAKAAKRCASIVDAKQKGNRAAGLPRPKPMSPCRLSRNLRHGLRLSLRRPSPADPAWLSRISPSPCAIAPLRLGAREDTQRFPSRGVRGGIPKPHRASGLIDGARDPAYGTWILPVRVSEHLVPLYAPPVPLNSSSHSSTAVPPPAAPS